MEQAYSAIKDRIMTLELRPGGRLDDVSLSRLLGISRTPVREALFLLSSEGLVSGGRGGFTIRPVDVLDVGQLFEAHVVAVRAVARLAALRATDEAMEGMRRAALAVDRAIEERSAAAIAAHNAELHRLEAVVARNEHLKGLAWSIHDQGQRLAYLCFGGRADWTPRLTEHFSHVTQDHHEFHEALTGRDPDAAEEIAARHVYLFRNRVQEFMFTDAADHVRLGVDLVDAGPESGPGTGRTRMTDMDRQPPPGSPG